MKMMVKMMAPSVVLPRPAWQEKIQLVEPFSPFRLQFKCHFCPNLSAQRRTSGQRCQCTPPWAPTPPQPELGHRRDKEGCPSDHCHDHGEDDNGEGEDGDDGDDSDGDEDDKDDDKNDEEEGFAQ